MPRVPIYESQIEEQGRDPKPTLLSGNRPRETAAGINELNETGQKILDIAQGIHDAELKRAEDAGIDADDVELSKIEGDIMKKETEKRGLNAYNSVEIAGDAWNERVKSIEPTKATRRRRDAFIRNVAIRQANMQQRLGVFVSGEMRRYYDEKQSERVDALQREAVENYADPNAVRLKLEEIRNSIGKYAENNGKPAEWLAGKFAAVQSESHIGVIARLVDAKQWQAAREYYLKNQKEVFPNERGDVEKVIRSGMVDTESSRIVDEIFEDAIEFDPTNPVLPLGIRRSARTKKEVREAIDSHGSLQVDDPELLSAVRKRAFHRLEEIEAEQRQERELSFLQVMDYVTKNQSLDGVPQAKLSLLSLSQREALEEKVQRYRAPKEIKSDPALKTHAFDLLTDGSLAEMEAGEVFSKFSKGLSESDYESVLRMWSQSRASIFAKSAESKKKATAEIEDIVQDNDRILHAFVGSGLGGVKPEDGMKEVAGNENKSTLFMEIRNSFDLQVEARASQNGGKAPSAQEKEEIIDLIILDMRNRATVKVDRGTYRTVVSLTEKDVASGTVEAPESVIEEAYSSYLSSVDGRPLDIDEFKDAYRRRIVRYWIAREKGRRPDFLARILAGVE